MNIKPATRFTNNGPWKQFAHLLSEVYEVFKALLILETVSFANRLGIVNRDTSDLVLRVAEELVDLQVSCQTLLAILGYTGDKYSTLKRLVMVKNQAKGYYDSPSV